jgi:hypothetical protein
MENRTNRRLVPDAKVQARYGRTAETLRAWEQNPRLEFPKAIRINGRKFRDEAELDEFDARRAAERETESSAA